MIRCTMRATSRPPAAMAYAFYDADGLKILHNKDDALVDRFDYILRELPMIPYTLSLIDADGNERFRLERKTPPPFQTHAFQLSFDDEVVDFFEDKARFSFPISVLSTARRNTTLWALSETGNFSSKKTN